MLGVFQIVSIYDRKNKSIMSNFGLYGFCLIVTASLVALLSMSTDFFVAYVNDIVIPCQHDSSWTGTQCNCDNTRGVFSGQYCGECECKHLGICGVVENGNSRWGCRCPNHEKWTGLLCDKCYATNYNEKLNKCSGPCKTSDTHFHFGSKCDTVCIPLSNAQDQICKEISSGGGSCNACNGHGSCTGVGQCECDNGWYTSLGGEQCSMSCASTGIVCPSERGTCQSTGGTVQCICRPGFYGANCDLTCESTNNHPCSGHGTCGLTSLGAPICTCETHYVGNMCQHSCPGNHNYSSTCSGHGTCQVEGETVVCNCLKDSNWLGFDCSCNERYTCSGHGKCTHNATCACNNWEDPTPQYWDGSSCHRCKKHWYGVECQMYCNPDETYVSDTERVDMYRRDGQRIGCNTRGTCEIIKSGSKEHVECSCIGMDPESFCARCEKYQYPKVSIQNPSVNWCSQTCGEDTCNDGYCNPDYDGSNDLCICYNIIMGTLTLSTLDPQQYCLSCKPNWYPSAGSNRCTRYCASEGQLEGGTILFGSDSLLQDDISAKLVCVGNDGDGYTPDADCRICSGHGTCGDDAQCVCESGITGLYCEIDCGDENGVVCSGHGKCVRNDLDMWFDPKTTDFRCDCEPYDTYTSATRQRLLKQGFQVNPPPDPNYYGKYCNFHCPRYNQEICAGRGSCKTAIAVQESGDNAGFFKDCFDDKDCVEIPGAFCAQLSTPWDSLMTNSKSFFSNSIESPGYVNCAPNQSCVDSIYSIKWDEYCVNMLNGWYPNVLNTAQCAYNTNEGCMKKVENFFAQKSTDTQKTWCELAADEISPISSDKCSANSFIDEELHNSVKTPICQGYDIKLACNSQEMCIYEQKFDQIKIIDAECTSRTVKNCNGACKVNLDGQCITKTYCRAKTCEDAINEVNIESMCVNTNPACPLPDKTDWVQECATMRGNIRKDSIMSTKNTFFNCMMRQNSKNPQTVLVNVPGNIPINGQLTITNPIEETINIQDLREKFILSRVPSGTCNGQIFNYQFDDFCPKHLQHSIPKYVKPAELNGEWFYEYLVVCPKDDDEFYYKESLHKDKNKALRRISELKGRMCSTPKYKCIQSTESWEGSCKDTDNSEFIVKPFKLECLNKETQYFEKLDYSKYPANPTSCVLTIDDKLLRWGNKRWDLDTLTTNFAESCEMAPSWIPQEKKIPSLCDMGACGPTATMCTECPNDVNCASGVLCGSPIPVDCHFNNPCGNGGHCHVPEKWPTNRYLCEWEHTNVRIFAEEQEFNGQLTEKGDLTIFNFVPASDYVQMIIISQNEFSSQTITDWHEIDGVNSIMTWKETFKQCTTGYYCPETKTCIDACSTCEQYKHSHGNYCSLANATCEADSYGCNYTVPKVVPDKFEECTADNDFNWFKYCNGKTDGSEILQTSASFGLIVPWEGNVNLLEENRIHLENAQITTSGQKIIIHIDLQRSDENSALAITINNNSPIIVDIATTGNIALSTDNITNAFTITRNLLTLDIEYSISYSSIQLSSMFGTVVVRSLKIDGIQQIKPYKESFLNNGRIINMGDDEGVDSTDYRSWKFEQHGSMVFHRDPSNAFVEKTCSYGETCPSFVVPHGSQWNLPEQPQFRVHGWSQFDNGASPINQLDENGKIANMKILNGDSNSVFERYVMPIVGTKFGKIHYVYNDVDISTSCKVETYNWWHWQIDVVHGNHSEPIVTTEDMFVQNKFIPEGTTIYNQFYSVKLKVNDCTVTDSFDVMTTARDVTHPNSIASSFHSLKSEEHECRQHCHKHNDCVQWSWTAVDTHCYLHATRCHEDENCVLGSHTLKALHPQTTTKFEVYNEAPNINTHWNFIRFEQLIDEPFQCSEINIETEIPSLWKDLFEEQYVPFSTDATGICNAISTQWQTIPGYNSGVCEGKNCEYNNNDMQSCADYLDHKIPSMNIEGCDEDLEKFNNLDWRSYCLYQQSFIPNGESNVEFLGGRKMLNEEGNAITFNEMCENTNIILNKTQSCDIQIEWYENCFDQTETYKKFCNNECIEHIETMFDQYETSTGDTSQSICSIRKDFLQIGDVTKMENLGLTSIAGCNNCDMNNIIISDFCSLQQVYHTSSDRILVPELANSQCSTNCRNTLRDSISRIEVRDWCEKLSTSSVKGTCSKTICECDTQSYTGVAGGICELSCPTGQQGDEEMACSGRNGRCFALDENAKSEDEIGQEISGEYRNVTYNMTYNQPLFPKWMKGPSPTMEGICQCAMGSGIACSIPCERCNNGTYGYEMSSQYGICDSFNGICRGLAPFMRYNTKFATGEDYISYNTTGFEGIKWEFPERFLYESDDTLVHRAAVYILDNDGLKPEYLEHKETEVMTKIAIDFVLRNFAALCWDFKGIETDFEYTNNGEATFKGINLETTKILKNITVNASGSCMLIKIPENAVYNEWYLCFGDGKMNAHSDDDVLMVIETGNVNIPKQGMTFCAQSSEVVYAFGGTMNYLDRTIDNFNNVYKIDVRRFAWDPLDIVRVHWNLVETFGEAPIGQSFAPVVCYDTTMYVVSDEYKVYTFTLPNTIVNNGIWLKSSDFPIHDKVYNTIKYQTAFDIIFESNISIRYTTGDELFSNSSKTKDDVDKITEMSSSQNGQQKCEIKIDGKVLSVGNNVIAMAKTTPSKVKIFLEEWVNIDFQTGADIYKRFENTILFENKPEQTLELSSLTDAQKIHALELVERIYMHQGRWQMNAMIQRKRIIADTLWRDENVHFLKLNILFEKITDKFINAFNAIPQNYLDTDPKTDAVEHFKITWEGETPNRILIITSNYNAHMSKYQQSFYIGSHLITLKMHDWSSTRFEMTLDIGDGFIEWYYSKMVRSFILTLPLEQWITTTPNTFNYEGKTGFTALFDMTIVKEITYSFVMQTQIAKFLSYSSSHCSITASKECPGMLPYIYLPCSGRGRCGISCQCACEIAPSELQINPSALDVPDWKKSPFRGDGCEIICPGYDGFTFKSICSGRGVCQYDGKCSCPDTHTGDSCQFKCPVDDELSTCSNNGGCGTKAIESTSFTFNGDNYLDSVTAKNKKSYSSTLNSFYSTCKENNYIEQRGFFNPINTLKLLVTGTDLPAFDGSKMLAFDKCESINTDIRQDVRLVRVTEFRDYPYGMCIGVTTTNQVRQDGQEIQKFNPVILKQPQWDTTHTLQALPLFKCSASDCTLTEHPNNEAGIFQIETIVLPRSFEFILKYVHGKSSGHEHYIVNGFDFMIETEWTIEKLKMTIHAPKWNLNGDDVFIFNGEIVMITLLMESLPQGERFKIKLYRSFSPQSSEQQIFLAPLYENNYMRILDENPTYTLVSETPSLQFDVTEYLCDLQPNCLGIIQWSAPFRENWFTMYSEVPMEGFEEYYMNDYAQYVAYKKMSLVYQGRTTLTSTCNVVEPGLAKYPSVTYSETYDMPIDNIDLSLSTDEETESIIIGNGLWDNCWKRYKNITTKKGCKEQAVNDKVYGFAFSNTNVCIVYHKMNDPTKIKLGRYNSESRRTLFNPCGNSTTWISM